MHLRFGVQFENVTASVRFFQELTLPNIAMIR
jgi:hypothetical protein